MVVCLQRVAQLVPLPLAVSSSGRVQIRFAFLVPAHVGSPGQGGVKRVCVYICFTAVNDISSLFLEVA